MRTSTGKPTKAEQARMDACRERGCVACIVNLKQGVWLATGMWVEIHHLKSGNKRRGHRSTTALCHYHHQAKFLPDGFDSYRDAAALHGPSLEREPAAFRQIYGTNDELLALQDRLIGWDQQEAA